MIPDGPSRFWQKIMLQNNLKRDDYVSRFSRALPKCERPGRGPGR